MGLLIDTAGLLNEPQDLIAPHLHHTKSDKSNLLHAKWKLDHGY